MFYYQLISSSTYIDSNNNANDITHGMYSINIKLTNKLVDQFDVDTH